MINLESTEELMVIPEITVLYDKKKKPQTSITSAKHSVTVFKQIWDTDINMRERVYAIFLNRKNMVMGVYLLSIGGVEGSIVDLKLLFGTATKMLASGIILAHNHPSGNLNPSNNDIKLTEKVKKAADILDIAFIDHIIITEEFNYYSFAEEGKL